MLEFEVMHKYCGYTTTVRGWNVWDALKSRDMDINIWIIISVRSAQA